MLEEHVSMDAILNTDESSIYTWPGQEFASHDTVNHQDEEYVRRDRKTEALLRSSPGLLARSSPPRRDRGTGSGGSGRAGSGERGRDVHAARQTAMPILWKMVLA